MRSRRILVVDDSAADRIRAAGLVEAAGYSTCLCSNGMEALALVAESCPDLVLTDLDMPEMTGRDLLAQLRQEGVAVPVIIMTGRGTEELAVAALREGAASYVPKPMLTTHLKETLQSVLHEADDDQVRERLMQAIDDQHLQWTLPTDLELIGGLVPFLQDQVQRMGICRGAEIARFGVAMQEALANAYYHGNLEVSSRLREDDDGAFYRLAQERARSPEYGSRTISVDVHLSRDEVTIRIADQGKGFAMADVPDPTAPENLEKASGRGLLLMRMFMDQVVFNESGNEITMTKRRHESFSVPEGKFRGT